MPRPTLVSTKQCELLVKLLQANPNFINRPTGVTLLESNSFWMDAAAVLNNIVGGCKKTYGQWRTFWNELKYKTKKRAYILQRELRTVDSSIPPPIYKQRPLTSYERKVLKLLSSTPSPSLVEQGSKVLAEGPGPSQAFLNATQDHTYIDLSTEEIKIEQIVDMPEESVERQQEETLERFMLEDSMDSMQKEKESVGSNPEEEDSVDSLHEDSVDPMHEESMGSVHEESKGSTREKSVESIFKIHLGSMRKESSQSIREKSAEPMREKSVGHRWDKGVGSMGGKSAGSVRETSGGPMREKSARPTMQERSGGSIRGRPVNSQQDFLDTDNHSRSRMAYKTQYNRRPANPFLSAIDFEERRLRVDTQMAKALNRIAGALERIVQELD